MCVVYSALFRPVSSNTVFCSGPLMVLRQCSSAEHNHTHLYGFTYMMCNIWYENTIDVDPGAG